MSKVKLKLLIWVALGGAFVAVALGIVRGASNLVAYFSASADPASVLNIVPNVPVDLAVGFEWLNEQPKAGREMEPATRDLIQGQYMRGWLQWNISYLKGKPFGLNTYFNDAAYHAVRESVVDARAEGWTMTQTDLEHHLELHFYSADGSIVSFTDHDVLVAQVLRDGTGSPITSRTIKADYDVVMMLIDGNWKVRHWTRKNAEIVNPATLPAPARGDEFVQVNGRFLILNDKPFTVRGINYYPQDAPWSLFWAYYDPAVVESDFQLISDLGLNSVRIFVPYAWPAPPHDADENSNEHGAAAVEVDSDEVEAFMRDNLLHLLDSAAAHDLKVIVTLFDFRTDYQILVWPEADRQIEALVPHFSDHPAILAWDIKNEPDFDRPGNTPEIVDLWLGHIAYQIRRYDPNHLLTIGWAEAENAHLLSDVVDFVSFHYYGPAGELAEKVQGLQAAIPEKPVVLTEFGLPTLNSPFRPHGHTANEQASYYSGIRHALTQVDSAGYMAWTLYDFTQMPRGVPGGATQKHLGIANRDGTLKPAALYLSADAPPDAHSVSLADRLLKPFYLTVLLAFSGTGVAAVFLIRLYRPTFADWLVVPLRVWVVAPLHLAWRPIYHLLGALIRRVQWLFGWGWKLAKRPFSIGWWLIGRVTGWGWCLLLKVGPFAYLVRCVNRVRRSLRRRIAQKLNALKAKLETEAARAASEN